MKNNWRFIFLIPILSGFSFTSFINANEEPINKDFALFTLIGCSREGRTETIWFKFCSDQQPQCPCDHATKSGCFSELTIKNNIKCSFTLRVKNTFSPQKQISARKNAQMVDLGEVIIDPNDQRHLLEGEEVGWNGHFQIKCDDWKSLAATNGEDLKIEWKGKSNAVCKVIFSYFKFPKSADCQLNNVRGYYLPNCQTVILVPNYSCEELLDGKQYHGAEGINWYCDGIVALKIGFMP